MKLPAIKPALGLLLLRLSVGLTMAVAHGYPKMMKLFSGEHGFPDPLGIGSLPSLALAVFAEVVCGALIAVGAFTRLAVVPFAITMAVAMFIVHGDDPWSKKEMAFLYLLPSIALFFTGPGEWSIDHWRASKK
ncbi:MAG: DoxX family protein [Myxococcota bacterium]